MLADTCICQGLQGRRQHAACGVGLQGGPSSKAGVSGEEVANGHKTGLAFNAGLPFTGLSCCIGSWCGRHNPLPACGIRPLPLLAQSWSCHELL